MKGIRGLIIDAPKVELHVHLEGTLEPKLLLLLARRNGIKLPYASISDVRAAYDFSDLQSFLDIYYEALAVLKTREDFADLTWEYMSRVGREGVRHAELFFDPQAHTARGVNFDVVVDGISDGLERARAELGMTTGLIACFLRHLGPDEAGATLDQILRRRELIMGVGLDSSEVGYPPAPFAEVFRKAGNAGLRLVAHAGEEGPASNVSDSLTLLQVERIDHGVRCLDDAGLVRRLADGRVPLTVCPLSNLALNGVSRLDRHPLARMLDAGLMVTVNSDDPAYFGGYITQNLLRSAAEMPLSYLQVTTLLRNAIDAAFIDDRRRVELHVELADATRRNPDT